MVDGNNFPRALDLGAHRVVESKSCEACARPFYRTPPPSAKDSSRKKYCGREDCIVRHEFNVN